MNTFAMFTAQGPEMLFAWIHFLAGITWIGLLYYFNFVHGAYMAEAPAEAKPGATRFLLPRALWWFRWGAVFTVLSGLAIITYWMTQVPAGISPMEALNNSRGVGIMLGATLGIIMFLNVWLVIWPKQKIVIASANAVAGGGTADPNAAAAAGRAFLASRTNMMFSIPLLFFMGNHRITFFAGEPTMSIGAPLGVCTVIIVLFELIGLLGTRGKGPAKMLEKHVAVIHIGLLLAVIFYFVVDGMLDSKAPAGEPTPATATAPATP
jgi:uncharacterized membrane protein